MRSFVDKFLYNISYRSDVAILTHNYGKAFDRWTQSGKKNEGGKMREHRAVMLG